MLSGGKAKARGIRQLREFKVALQAEVKRCQEFRDKYQISESAERRV